MPELDELRSLSHQLRPPSLEALADVARRRERRTAVAVAAGATSVVVAVIAIVMVAVGPGHDGSRLDPAPEPTPSVSTSGASGTERGVFVPEVTPDDLRRWEELATVTNADPDHLGDTDLRFDVPVRGGNVDWGFFCTGDPDTWYIAILGDTGAEAYGYCDIPLRQSPPPLPTDISAFGDSGSAPATIEVRMFVTGPIPQQHLDCFDRMSPADCQDVKPPLEPLESTDVTFGVSVFEHWAPPVVEVAGEGVGALVSTGGVDYVLRRVAQGRPGATGLSLELDPSRPELLVGVVQSTTRAMVTCGTGATSSAEERACHPDVMLRLGGRRVKLERGEFGDIPMLAPPLLYRVPAGTAGRIDLRVTRGPPEHVGLAILVFEATE